MSSESRSSPQKHDGTEGAKKSAKRHQDVTVALRRAYDSAVDESIPQSMLDLLGKLS